MADAIVVINAGSSSIKFSLFAVRGDDLVLDVGGQLEGIYTAPHFVATDPSGRVVAERKWSQGTQLGHTGAVEHLRRFLREELQEHQLIRVGHRVVHGGLAYRVPVRVDGGCSRTSSASSRSPGSPSTSTCTASGESLVHSPLHPASSTRWFSRPALARTPRPSASA